MSSSGEPRKAPPGSVWVCQACGKYSKDRFGDDPVKSRGWDASCMLNSALYDICQLNIDEATDRVTSIKGKDADGCCDWEFEFKQPA